jgi:UDP-N-acetylglucosamine--N-acetylmuramyl-(pentapeptide) pyrophosphoryl-undecaprenol N-acetylglucosamine transferase
MPEQINILISGGGTGGHIFPAIAIANGLKSRLKDPNILFVGAKGKMEMEKVPQTGYRIEGLWISGLQRKLNISNLSFPFKLISSLRKASKIISQFKPKIAIGTGGYASGPLLFMAARKKVPTLILEQNSYPGITNKLLAKRVNRICVAYDSMESYFPKDNIVLTGSPIRTEILELKPTKNESLKFFGLLPDKKTLLIIGGSQGAYKVNLSVAEQLDRIMNEDIQLIWQTGKFSFEMAKQSAAKSKFSENIKVVDFIMKMDMAYASADLVVSRAGAIAIAEIIAVKKPSIFIPLPSAAEDHQTKNAMTLVKGHAALMIEESNLKSEFATTVNNIMNSEQERLIMIQNLKRFSYPDATEAIVDEIMKLIEQ